MKILYLLNEEISKPTGIAKKIQLQTSMWRRAGWIVNVLSLSSSDLFTSIDSGSVLIKRRENSGVVDKFVRNWRGFSKLRSYINNFKPEVIYSRGHLYSPNMIKSMLGTPYIVELNSIDVNEAMNLGIPTYYYNKLTRHVFLKNASGFVSISKEIDNHESFKKFANPSIIIANGYEFERYERETKYSDDTPHAIFIGSEDNPWYGTDKIVEMAKNLPSIQFHIIGNIRARDLSNVKFYGTLSEDAANSIIRRCHVGISSLGLHRNKMMEASPLKSRQYFSSGLPVIMGYKDTDLTGDEDYCYNIGNYEKNVKNNINNIKAFIHNCMRFDGRQIYADAKNKLSLKLKEEKRMNFIIRVMNK